MSRKLGSRRLSFAISGIVAMLLTACGQHAPQSIPQISSTTPPRSSMSSTTVGCDSSITGNFNGTQINAGSTLWFSAIMKVSGIGSSPVTLTINNSTIAFTSNGATTTVPVPNASVTITPGASTATVSYANGWTETVPYPFSGNVLLDAVQYPVSANLAGGIQNVTWSGHFTSSQSGVSAQWAWAAAAYKQFSSDYNALGVKPVDANNTSQYLTSDHAGTPENFKTYVTGGATGGGGSNYTGSLSGTTTISPCLPPSPTPAPTPTPTSASTPTVAPSPTATVTPDPLVITCPSPLPAPWGGQKAYAYGSTVDCTVSNAGYNGLYTITATGPCVLVSADASTGGFNAQGTAPGGLCVVTVGANVGQQSAQTTLAFQPPTPTLTCPASGTASPTGADTGVTCTWVNPGFNAPPPSYFMTVAAPAGGNCNAYNFAQNPDGSGSITLASTTGSCTLGLIAVIVDPATGAFEVVGQAGTATVVFQ